MGPSNEQEYDYLSRLDEALATGEYNQVNNLTSDSSYRGPNTIRDQILDETISEEVPENNIFKIPDFPEYTPSNTIGDQILDETISEEVPENNIFKIPDFPEYTPSNTIGDPILDETISEEVPENNIFKGEIETYPNLGVKVTVGEDGPSVGAFLPGGVKYEEKEDGSAKWQASVGLGNVQFDTGPITLSMDDTPEPKEDFLD